MERRPEPISRLLVRQNQAERTVWHARARRTRGASTSVGAAGSARSMRILRVNHVQSPPCRTCGCWSTVARAEGPEAAQGHPQHQGDCSCAGAVKIERRVVRFQADARRACADGGHLEAYGETELRPVKAVAARLLGLASPSSAIE